MTNMSNSFSFLNSFVNFESRLHQTSAQEFSLDLIKTLLQHLGNPDKQLKIIHVAGTKGKGSTSVMIASLLRAAGFSVGLYTSPHLYDLNERIRILKPELPLIPSLYKEGAGGSLNLFSDSISDLELDAVIQEIRQTIEDVHRASSRGLTFFEVMTAVALYYFAQEKVDWVVLETGLGGRLDATNAVDSVAAVITPVSLEHQNILGETLEEIAAEKAGIIKSPAQQVIIAPQSPAAEKVFQDKCRGLGVMPFWAADHVSVECLRQESGGQVLNFKTPSCEYNNIHLALTGSHQSLNAATAVCVAEVLRISFAAGRLNAAFSDVKWPGRFEIVDQDPAVVLDCAHNEDSMRVLLETVRSIFPGRKPYFILGVSQDKNIAAMSRLLQTAAKCVILTRADHPRAYQFSGDDTQRYFPGVDVQIAASATEALEKARQKVDRDDVIVVTGSLFLVAEARQRYV